MVFQINKQRMYHMPHNTALLNEFKFLLEVIDEEKSQYTFKELVKLLLLEQIKQDRFKEFHGNMPYRIFTQEIPPDKDDLIKKFKKIRSNRTKPNGMPDWLFNLITKKSVEEATKKLIEKRKESYNKFVQDPENRIDDFLNCQYKPTKTWKQNWVEFVRDYVDFAAYCGLIPCYYKLPGERSSEEDGYVVSEKLKEYKRGNFDLKDIIFHFKYSNSSINTRRYTQFNIRVRPFYLVLRLLDGLEKKGVAKVERRLLFGAISCFKSEDEIEDAIKFISNFIDKNDNLLSEKNFSSQISKEASRVATGMLPFLEGLNLIECIKDRGISFFKITDEGKKLLSSYPSNSLFFGQYVKGIFYSPLLARLLNIFADCVKNEESKIEIKILKEKLKISQTEIFDQVLSDLLSLKPCPIIEIKKGIVYLNDLSYQYSVTPFVDFASLKEAEYVIKGGIPFKATKLKKIELPDSELLKEIESRALSDDGSKYEEILETALKKLPGLIKRFGQSSSFTRLSDVVWLVDVPIDGKFKKVLTIIEAKAGKAIKSFKETKEIEDIKNTILEFKEHFTDLYGVWILIVDSDQMPSINKHGGYRGAGKYQLSFRDKLLRIHHNILTSFGKPVLVTGFDVYSFIEYYKYLYSNLYSSSDTTIHEHVEQFFMRGNLFFDDYRYIKVINDANEIKSQLFI
ncbi:MAG: hypothetical protein ACLFPJ_02270 [Candidatus Woesearchaeota archaeon]